MFRSVNFPGWGKSGPPTSSSSTSHPPTSSAQPARAARDSSPASASNSPSNTNARRPGSKDQPLGRSFLGPPKSSSKAAAGGASPSSSARPQIGGKGVFGHTGGKVGLGGKGLGLGKGKGGFKRHRKIMKDTVKGITKGDIRRLARRGGVKRLSAPIYEDTREAIKDRLTLILKDCICYVEHRNAKTITVSDVIFALQRIGRPIYGFGERRNMFR